MGLHSDWLGEMEESRALRVCLPHLCHLHSFSLGLYYREIAEETQNIVKTRMLSFAGEVKEKEYRSLDNIHNNFEDKGHAIIICSPSSFLGMFPEIIPFYFP